MLKVNHIVHWSVTAQEHYALMNCLPRGLELKRIFTGDKTDIIVHNEVWNENVAWNSSDIRCVTLDHKTAP